MQKPWLVCLAVLSVLTGCPDDGDSTPDKSARSDGGGEASDGGSGVDAASEVSADAGAADAGTTVGAQGGSVLSPDGVTLEVPAGALQTDVELTVAVSKLTVPAAVNAHSAVYGLGPDGQVFTKSITITLPTDGADPMLLRAYHTKRGTTEFEAINLTAADRDSVTFEVDHFSSVFIGEMQACAGTDACKQAACSADDDCTLGGVCSGDLKEAGWVCLVPDPNGECSWCKDGNTCNARGLCTAAAN
jgi:hypothetical protein